MQTKEIKMLKKGLAIFFFVIALIGLFSSCADKQDEISVNADGYVVVNGVVTEIVAEKEDVITVDTDGYVIVNGVKTEHKIHTADEISVNADGFVVVNGITTEIIADKADVITVDSDGYVVVNGVKTKYKIQQIDFSSLTWAAFGDSITYGELPLSAGAQMPDPYVKLVSEALGIGSYTNFAKGGATWNDTGNRPEWRPCMTNEILSYTGNADIISVMLGTNDFTYPSPLGEMGDKTTASVYGSLYLVAEHLTKNHKDAFVFFATPYKCVYGDMEYSEANALGYRLEDYVNAIKEVAAPYDIPVIDMYTEGQFELEMYTSISDGVHPSQEFVREYTAPQIAEFIRENYNEKTPEETPSEPLNVFSDKTMACIGDSITYGFCGDHSKPPFTKNYPNCVKSFLGLKEVYNYGACGCLLARVPDASYTSMIDKIDLIPANTDIISVFGGINDFVSYVPMGDINSTDEYTIYGALNAIAYKLTTGFENSFVFFITPLDIGEENLITVNNTLYSVEDVCTAIKEVGEKWNIPVYDANSNAGFDPELHSFDGCHPTEDYYSSIFAPKIVEFIKQSYNENATETTVDFSEKTYVAFGDSITFGADYTRNYSQMDNPYPKLVFQQLNLKSYTNYAISGSTIATGVDDLPSIYNQIISSDTKADIISVMGGVNDYNRNVEIGSINDNNTTTFYGSLKAICETLLNKYSTSFCFFMTPYKEDCYHQFSCTELNQAGYCLEDYANAITDVAQLYNIPVLDMYNEGQFELEMYNADSDGIHPSQEFITQYTAPQIAEFIKQNYK